jgi:Conserved membrane protein YqhR
MANLVNETKSDYPEPMSILTLVFWTGLFGGILWSTIGYLAYILNFTEIHPNIILEPWALGEWKKEWLGTVISIILIGVISVGVAFIYYAAMRKLKGIWPGLVYGIVLFLLVFLVLNPLFPGIAPFFALRRDTMITSICLYAVYGIFIGYSISYEYQNHIGSEKDPAT